MNNLSPYTGQIVEIELTSKKHITGKLIEVGSDIIVVFNGQKFVYLSVMHIDHVKKAESIDGEYAIDDSSKLEMKGTSISLRGILTNAIGIFVEVSLSGNHTVYGYIRQIQADYVVFYSPAFNNLNIPIVHFKWLIPYIDQTPYDIKIASSELVVDPTCADTFEEQLKSVIGKMVIFDLGKDPQKIGMVKAAENNAVELITGNSKIIYINTSHIKSFHD